MKRASGFSFSPLFLFVGLVPVPQTLAQCYQGWMCPQYSTYSSYSTDGTHIYTSVVVSGTTTGTCPPGYNCSQIIHTGYAYNTIGNVGGWDQGTAVPWNGWLDDENDQSLTAADHNTDYYFSNWSNVFCTVAGLFYQGGGGVGVYLRIVETTLSVWNVLPPSTCLTRPSCLPGQTPVCSESEVYDSKGCGIGYDCETLAYRFSQSDSYSCAPAAYCIKTTTLPGWCDE
jgi:hypothetical protein